MKCYVCGDKKISKVFTNIREVKHYYCKSCAKKYLVKIPKLEEKA